MSALEIQWDRIRRRWVLVLVIGLLAAAGALGASVLQGTSYTGRAALTIVSLGRQPEQDASLAQGYTDYFNQPSTQESLRRTTGMPESVALNARIAAAAPIIYVEATAKDSGLAGDAAGKMATVLRDSVNQALQADAGRRIQDLQGKLAAARAANDNDQVGQLKSNISDLQNGANQLQDLQTDAGVSANSPSTARTTLAALIGGLVLGALLALALGSLQDRIAAASEVRGRLGLRVLAEVGGRRQSEEDSRRELSRALMGLSNAYGLPVPGSLAVTGPGSARASKSTIAMTLAGLRAAHGQMTLLLQTDLTAERSGSPLSSLPGVADFLAERGAGRIEGKVFSDGRALLVGPPGSERDDSFSLFARAGVQRLLRQGTGLADLVIIDAPPAESVEGQIVCAVADRTLVVVETNKTRMRDATAALEALGQSGVAALGAVVVGDSRRLQDPGFLKNSTWSQARVPAPGPDRPGTQGPDSGSGPVGVGPVPPNRPQATPAKSHDESRPPLGRDSGGAAAMAAGMALGGSSGPNGHPVKGPNPAPAGDAAARSDKPEGAKKPGADDGSGRAPHTPSAPRPGPGSPAARPGSTSLAGQDGKGPDGSGPAGAGAKGPGGQGPGGQGPGAQGPGPQGPGAQGAGNQGPGNQGPGAATTSGKGPTGAGPGGKGPSGTAPGPKGPTGAGPGPKGAGGPGVNGSGTPGPAKPSGPTGPKGPAAPSSPGQSGSGSPSASSPARAHEGARGGEASRVGNGAAGSAAAGSAAAGGARPTPRPDSSARDQKPAPRPDSAQRDQGPAAPKKPSPRPKPAEPQQGSESAAAASRPSLVPGAPEGAKRIGTARFVSRSGASSSATGTSGGSPDAERTGSGGAPKTGGGDQKTSGGDQKNGGGDQKAGAAARKPEDGLSAPTVTMRAER